MAAAADQKVHLARAVMHRVESPEERDFVAESAAPVVAEFAYYQGQRGAQPERHCRDDGIEVCRQELMGPPHHQAQRSAQQSTDHKAVDEVIPDIDGDFPAEYLLLMQREHPFQWNKDRARHRQPET